MERSVVLRQPAVRLAFCPMDAESASCIMSRKMEHAKARALMRFSRRIKGLSRGKMNGEGIDPSQKSLAWLLGQILSRRGGPVGRHDDGRGACRF
jgi:hypothetical protein